MRQFVRTALPVVPALVVYALLSHHPDFTRDDAHIFYRYVANYLNGDGLVCNVEQLVEGFTNFSGVIYPTL